MKNVCNYKNEFINFLAGLYIIMIIQILLVILSIKRILRKSGTLFLNSTKDTKYSKRE